MKKVLLSAVVLAFTTLCYTAQAQEDKEVIIEKDKTTSGKEKKETQEIIIRKKGDKDAKITVEIKGNKVTINGKSISDFNDSTFTVYRRMFRFSDGKQNFSFGPGDDLEMLFNGNDIANLRSGKPRAYLGVTSNTVTDDTKEKMPNGAEITNITKNSAAEKAGLKEGDVITKINSTKIELTSDLSKAIGSQKPGDEVTIHYKRDGKDMSAKAKLGETKSQSPMAFSFSGPNGQMRSFTIPRMPAMPRTPRIDAMPNFDFNGTINGDFDLGSIADAPYPFRPKLGLKIQDTEEGNGVKVLDAEKDSPAEKAGLQKDDVITEIGGEKINNTDDAREKLRNNAEKAAYTIKVNRNGKEMSFDIKFPKKLKTANL